MTMILSAHSQLVEFFVLDYVILTHPFKTFNSIGKCNVIDEISAHNLAKPTPIIHQPREFPINLNRVLCLALHNTNVSSKLPFISSVLLKFQ